MQPLPKPTVSKKVRAKLSWLAEHYELYPNRHELIEAMQQEFGGHPKRLLTVVDVYLGKRPNTSSHRARHETVVRDESICYFCSAGSELLTHHITYVPENVVVLCNSCHHKIHHVMSTQHLVEVKRARDFRKFFKAASNLYKEMEVESRPDSDTRQNDL